MAYGAFRASTEEPAYGAFRTDAEAPAYGAFRTDAEASAYGAFRTDPEDLAHGAIPADPRASAGPRAWAGPRASAYTPLLTRPGDPGAALARRTAEHGLCALLDALPQLRWAPGFRPRPEGLVSRSPRTLLVRLR
ncbi:hypothetical protein ACFVYF_24940 [Streptomyces sp. NPDC058274]|uniref:hypothetical protein n=1 Tax=Streptomyces sp. NPDC058274 TaxID=3346416 RepID=UPI0036EEE51A